MSYKSHTKVRCLFSFFVVGGQDLLSSTLTSISVAVRTADELSSPSKFLRVSQIDYKEKKPSHIINQNLRSSNTFREKTKRRERREERLEAGGLSKKGSWELLKKTGGKRAHGKCCHKGGCGSQNPHGHPLPTVHRPVPQSYQPANRTSTPNKPKSEQVAAESEAHVMKENC